MLTTNPLTASLNSTRTEAFTRSERGVSCRCLVQVSVAAMADQFADSANNVVIEEVNKGLNPGMIVLIVVATFLLLFFVGNYALYMYAQKTLPPRKKKPVSKKKLKKEKLKQGVSAPGE
ncbi:hypothetical protein GUJ93_ZPchr0014g46996 [Zizania palustris]|uniref:DNA-binding protein S1FA n=1 Tax=Zizania palustris TaxID=103762 RepID=A0A8J5TFP5_ZIZPA|nr:hypothetical protein GUJ93_ZPchr0014g46996 [Zizania palustris]